MDKGIKRLLSRFREGGGAINGFYGGAAAYNFGYALEEQIAIHERLPGSKGALAKGRWERLGYTVRDGAPFARLPSGERLYDCSDAVPGENARPVIWDVPEGGREAALAALCEVLGAPGEASPMAALDRMRKGLRGGGLPEKGAALAAALCWIRVSGRLGLRAGGAFQIPKGYVDPHLQSEDAEAALLAEAALSKRLLSETRGLLFARGAIQYAYVREQKFDKEEGRANGKNDEGGVLRAGGPGREGGDDRADAGSGEGGHQKDTGRAGRRPSDILGNPRNDGGPVGGIGGGSAAADAGGVADVLGRADGRAAVFAGGQIALAGMGTLGGGAARFPEGEEAGAVQEMEAEQPSGVPPDRNEQGLQGDGGTDGGAGDGEAGDRDGLDGGRVGGNGDAAPRGYGIHTGERDTPIDIADAEAFASDGEIDVYTRYKAVMTDEFDEPYAVWDELEGDYAYGEGGEAAVFPTAAEAEAHILWLREQAAQDAESRLNGIVANGPQAVAENAPEKPRGIDFRLESALDALDTGYSHFNLQTHAKRNMGAIRLLKKIEGEGRMATAEEQKNLALYSGFGGMPQLFDPDVLEGRGKNGRFKEEARELRDLLTDAEWKSARASTPTAFYTPPETIEAIYAVLGSLGFEKGRILDPAFGTGHFAGMLPEKMRGSEIVGVETDSLSARIARQLYQNAHVHETGFEGTHFEDGSFDAAIGNVPFANVRLHDKEGKKYGDYLIHDYFFCKALDKVRPGGVVAFITDKGTLDKANPMARRYLAERAELLGAVRLPENVFSGAGTAVTSDIVFLQKRETPAEGVFPPWAEAAETVIEGKKHYVNRYFLDNPEMALGVFCERKGRYGSPAVYLRDYFKSERPEGETFADRLAEAAGRIKGKIRRYAAAQKAEMGAGAGEIPAPDGARDFSFVIQGGKPYFNRMGNMAPAETAKADVGRVIALAGVRDALRDLIALQRGAETTDGEIAEAQARLRELYDGFVRRHGRIKDAKNKKAFGGDESYHLLSSLEKYGDGGEFIGTADIFEKRTIWPHKAPDHADTAEDALAISISEKACVDMAYMARLTGKSEEGLFSDLEGLVYRDDCGGEKQNFVTAAEFLSGNVRSKLRLSRERLAGLGDGAPEAENLKRNIAALEKALPEDIGPEEITARLGAAWIPAAHITRFMRETFEVPFYRERETYVSFEPITGEWNISGKSAHFGIASGKTYGTGRINGYHILEKLLNLSEIRIMDRVTGDDGREKYVPNKKETALAQEKADLLSKRFSEWVFADEKRSAELCRIYNDRFNSLVDREYDGSNLVFPEMNAAVELRPHQRDAIARILYGGKNALLAHQVGAGKTYEMIAAAQESKRLGLCKKSLFVVPNHIIGQFAKDYMTLYPAAGILVAEAKDFKAANRKEFTARIATGGYDAIIMGHSQFEKIPVSKERQALTIERELDEISAGLEAAKGPDEGGAFTAKQLEKAKKNLETKLSKLFAGKPRDQALDFEELGVDRLFIDEAHHYKNLFFPTKMGNVAGVNNTGSEKSSDLYMKCRCMDELTGGKGVVFATGTPVSNSMSELYTMKRYLAHGLLKEHGLHGFDAWASVFGEKKTEIEIAPEGGFRQKTRFAKFHNLPELMSMFRDFADVKTQEQMGLPLPEASFLTIASPPSAFQKKMVEGLAERAERVRRKKVGPEQDNLLAITGDGRRLALDQRLMDPALPPGENGKIAKCAENVARIYRETAEAKSAQLVFCDISTPNNGGRFSVYADMRARLIGKGVAEGEIAFVHDAGTEGEKEALLGRVRAGSVRVLLGSTEKLGAGTNCQKRLIALHDLDCPWRPSDLEQRAGRIVRQGNENGRVEIYRYVTEGTFDAYMYQLVENKQRFISQVMAGRAPVRQIEEERDGFALDYAQIKALAAGDPLLIEKTGLELELQKLKMYESDFRKTRREIKEALGARLPEKLARLRRGLAALDADIETMGRNSAAGFSMRVGDALCGSRSEAAEALGASLRASGSAEIWIMGLAGAVEYDGAEREYACRLGAGNVRVPFGKEYSPSGAVTRIENALKAFPEKRKAAELKIEEALAEAEAAKAEAEKPSPYKPRIDEAEARLAQIGKTMEENSEEYGEGGENETEGMAAQEEGKRIGPVGLVRSAEADRRAYAFENAAAAHKVSEARGYEYDCA